MSDKTYMYIVRLTPVGSYFFGGETTFGDGKNQNYLVRSCILPQVSAVLGVLRYEILRRNNLLETGAENDAEKKEKWPEYIGEPFNIEAPAASYGQILEISPIFIERERDGVLFTPCPADLGYDVTFKNDEKVSYLGTKIPQPLITKHGTNTICEFKHYDNWKKWVGTDGNTVDADEIFINDERVGINKLDGAPDRDKAYFEQTQIRLGDGYHFCFSMTTSEKFDEEPVFVQMGGNRSVFKMELVESADVNLVEKFRKVLQRNGRLLLLGDAWIKSEERENYDFIWGERIVNRYISNIHKWNGNRSETMLYHLLGRGSVIYANDKRLTELKKNDGNLSKVGLNIFI